ncbi:hypothetical protein [Chryseobacterium daeguense]|uniref:hypothetical protein n=1 Tax=Chryseobacterium daeguense TaxID=412438 RepID=UPI0012DCBD30|nr:hypothetical protein [Chryseobacterium daeguense]
MKKQCRVVVVSKIVLGALSRFPLQFLITRLRFAPPLHSGIFTAIGARAAGLVASRASATIERQSFKQYAPQYN